ncbi:response regulator transcription factor [Romboutsia lituseburensis]|uniref:response regulator transcription factor n=1 Tax=Romboutsia lituseburensis TaxID=1537 RepID=UPI0022EADFC6|nr:response regulator transcription factor [Romboutsia lituseburensis]
MNILIADDEVSMLKILQVYFKKEGYNVLTARDGQEALDLFYTNKIDLAILDWMMPKIDGINVCKEIKKKSNTKVLILTAKSQIEDELDALSCGADEYISKPFDPRVLIIRSKKLIGEDEILKIKNLKIDLKTNKVYKDEVELNLTKKELELIKCFVDNKGIILSREKLLNLVWGMDYFGDDRTVDTHIRRLRTKIGEEMIITHRGIGYSLEGIND